MLLLNVDGAVPWRACQYTYTCICMSMNLRLEGITPLWVFFSLIFITIDIVVVLIMIFSSPVERENYGCSHYPNDVPPEPQWNVSITAKRGAVRPSKKLWISVFLNLVITDFYNKYSC